MGAYHPAADDRDDGGDDDDDDHDHDRDHDCDVEGIDMYD